MNKNDKSDNKKDESGNEMNLFTFTAWSKIMQKILPQNKKGKNLKSITYEI
jgi:hypothetical protein